ncbi:hypothetical protein OROGR_022644 [Orobanche gracilis]
MARSSKLRVPWPDLPKELIQKIATCLDTETDVRRLRAVCSSWRSSTTPFKKLPHTPIKLPFPFDAANGGGTEISHSKHDGAYFSLTERTVYRVQSPDSRKPSFWLVKVESSGDGKLRLLNPISDHQIKVLPGNPMPKVLNTLDFRVSEVCTAYTLHYVNPSNPKRNDEYKYAKKVAVSAGSVDNNNFYVVMSIDDRKKLWYITSGDQNWTMVQGSYGTHNSFLDVVWYKGQFYGIDVNGGAWVFDSMFSGTKITYYLHNGASKRHLMDLYDEELYLVEFLTDKDKQICECYDIDSGCQCRFPPVKNMVVEIIISKMDKQEGAWVVEKTVNDRIIFAGDDCSFCLPAREFKGCNGTLVFYTDRYFYFQTEKPHLHDDFDYDADGDYDCNYFECDCCVLSDDEAGKVDDFVPDDNVKLKLRGLHGHNTGVCIFESGKMGSLLRFPEYADIFWPPPSWIR